MIMGLVVIVTVLMVYLAWIYFFKNKISVPVNVPGAKFIIGHAHLFNKTEADTFETIFLRLQNPKYGHITHMKIFSVSMVSLNTVKVAEGLLKSPQNVNKSYQYDPLEVLLTDSVLILPNSSWQTRRKMLTPSFHFTIMEGFEKCMIKNAIILKDLLSQDKDITFMDIISQVTAMNIMETSFGVEYQKPNECKNIIENIGHSLQWIFERNFTIFAGRHWDWFYYKYTEMGRKIMDRIKKLDSTVSKIIDDRKRAYDLGNTNLYKGRRPFLDHLIHQQAKNGNISNKQILGECKTIIIAGLETSASAIGYTLYFLCKHPYIQKKLYCEIKEHLSGKDFTDLNVSDLKYLTMVVKESMRIQPPVGFISRQLTTDYKVEDYVIPSGTQIGIPIWWLHRDPEVWNNPEVFDPERFSAENSKGRSPYAFVPFSAGPRGCLGQRFGLTEVKIMVATLVYYFKMSTDQEMGKDLIRKGFLVSSIGSNFVIDFKPRN